MAVTCPELSVTMTGRGPDCVTPGLWKAAGRSGVGACVRYLGSKREFLRYDQALSAGWRFHLAREHRRLCPGTRKDDTHSAPDPPARA